MNDNESAFILRKAYKYRLYPTKAQTSRLANQFSMCRHLYNQALKERIDFYKSKNASLRFGHQCLYLSMLKKARPWYASVYSQVLVDVLKRLERAYENFFRRAADPRVIPDEKGFPKFKKRGQWNSITYPQYCRNSNVFLVSEKVIVPKIGNIKVVLHREVPQEAKIKTLTVSQEGGKWFACFSTQTEISVELKQGLPPLGIDLGLIDFVYASDGWSIPAPKFLRQSEKRLKLFQNKLSKAKKRTPEYYKLLGILQKCHYRVKCCRNDFLHKTANKVLEKSDTIFYEKLDLAKMTRRPKPKKDEGAETFLPNGATVKSGLNKAINDAGWGRFVAFLQQKAEVLGKKVLSVPPRYTSQKCSECGAMVRKSLSVRTHKCKCGFVANRDYNAACNILRIGLDTQEVANS